MLAPWALAAQQPRRPTILSRLVWFDRAGTRLGGIGPAADHGNVELSPDGSRVAVAVAARPGSPRDVWIYNTSSGARTQFTSDSADENWLVWSADGRHVILNSFGPERLDLFEALFSNANARKTLLSGGEAKWPVSLSRDGRFLLYVTDNKETNNDIWVLPLRNRARPYPFLRSEAAENWAAFSPDGKWIAFSSTEGGQPEVYVAAFPPNGRHWRVSADGGSQARWRRDGKEIFYLAPDRTLMAASVTASKRELVVNEYRPLFQVNNPYGAYHAFDVAADGQRFLVNTLVVDPGSSGVVASLSSACTGDPAASVAESAKMRGMTGCRPSTTIRGLMP
jgi:Tol biopolymer transport system component